MPDANEVVDTLFTLTFVGIFLALAIVWLWNPIAARFSLPLIDVSPYLPGLLIAGLVLYLVKNVAQTYR